MKCQYVIYRINTSSMIQIEQEVFDKIFEIAKSELPNEACGYLAGKDGIISYCYKLENADRSPEHYSFNPAEQFEVYKDARSRGLKILANFHSHPMSPARPSDEDIRLAYDSEILYGIVSLEKPEGDLKFYLISQQKPGLIHYSII
jgi:[CysO sulfur-carrier protein]-S-L-cysteine hydrolase